MHSKNGKGGKPPGDRGLLPLVQQYLGSILFKHAHHYETVTSVHAQYLDFHHQKVPLAHNKDLEYEERSLEKLLMGSNPGFWFSVQLLRVLQYGQALICLAMDELYPYNINRFVIIAIVFADREAAGLWADSNGYLTSLCIKNPYRTIHTVYSRTSFVVTRPENIIVKGNFKFNVSSAEQVKSQANSKFREKLYQQALLTYEVGLGMIRDPEKKRQRAVLYANSSQCLFEMRLYESALIYAEISSALDKKYVKAFFRKFTCLLELRETSNIPQVLNSIRRVGTPTDFEDASQKYTKYLSNSIGFYDWKEMFSDDSCIFGQYYSNKLEKVKNQKFSSKKYSYRAYETMNPYELIMVQKPLIYQNSKHQKFGEDYSEMTQQIKNYSQYESYFYSRFNQLPSQCLFQGNVLNFSKNLPQGIQINEIHSKCLRCLQLQKTVLKASATKEEYMGIWDNLYLFRHSCLSNCTYLHIKGCLVVFSLTKIEKGEPLTIDFLNWETQKLGRRCDCAFCVWEWEYESGASGQFLYQFYGQQKERLQEGGLDKISLYFLWQLIYLRSYNQIELMKEYLVILQRYPMWECVINCFRYLRSRSRNDVFDHVKSTLKRIFQRYFKLTHAQAVGLLKNIL